MFHGQDCEYPNLCTRILGFLGEEVGGPRGWPRRAGVAESWEMVEEPRPMFFFFFWGWWWENRLD